MNFSEIKNISANKFIENVDLGSLSQHDQSFQSYFKKCSFEWIFSVNHGKCQNCDIIIDFFTYFEEFKS
jgi:hypothetical protein